MSIQGNKLVAPIGLQEVYSLLGVSYIDSSGVGHPVSSFNVTLS